MDKSVINKFSEEKLVFKINGWELTANQAKLLFQKIVNSKIPLPTITIEGIESKKIYEVNNIDVIYGK
jgi:hypothetical protein